MAEQTATLAADATRSGQDAPISDALADSRHEPAGAAHARAGTVNGDAATARDTVPGSASPTAIVAASTAHDATEGGAAGFTDGGHAGNRARALATAATGLPRRVFDSPPQASIAPPAGDSEPGATAADPTDAGGAAPNIDRAHSAAAIEREAPLRAPMHAPWAERVVESVRLATLRGGGEMRLRLEPAGLGHIDVRISLEHDGVRAVIVAEHDSTRALLEREQHLLHAALERSELRLAGFSVDLGFGSSGSAFTDAEEGARAVVGGGPRLAAETEVPPVHEMIAAAAEPGRLSVRV